MWKWIFVPCTHFRFQIARDDYLDNRFMMTSGFCPISGLSDIENRYNLTRRAPTLHRCSHDWCSKWNQTRLQEEGAMWKIKHVSFCSWWKSQCLPFNSNTLLIGAQGQIPNAILSNQWLKRPSCLAPETNLVVGLKRPIYYQAGPPLPVTCTFQPDETQSRENGESIKPSSLAGLLPLPAALCGLPACCQTRQHSTFQPDHLVWYWSHTTA